MLSPLSIFSASTFPPAPAGMPPIGTVCEANWGQGIAFPPPATICYYRAARAILIDATGKESISERIHTQGHSSPIGWHVLNKTATQDEVASLIALSESRKIADAAAKAQALSEEAKACERGQLVADTFPGTTQALIVATRQEDHSDSQTDYYASRTVETIVLAVSSHKRDIFSEMRKAAGRIPETAHLVTGGTEHREKYSMGGGFYLKDGSRHSSGWRIAKVPLYNQKCCGELLASLGIRHGL